MSETEDLTPEALIAWKKDPRGERFWAELREIFERRATGLRTAVRMADFNMASQHNGALDMIEEVIQLPDVLLQEDALAKEDRLKEQGETNAKA